MSTSKSRKTYSSKYHERVDNLTLGVTEIDHDVLYAVTQYDSEVEHSTRLPNWRQLISNGLCATTPLSGTDRGFEVIPSDMTVRKTSTNPLTQSRLYNTSGFYQDEGQYPLGLILSETSAYNQALSRFYSSVAAKEAKFKGLVFSGELKESLSMIRHPAQALRRGLTEYLSHLRRVGPTLPFRQRRGFIRKTWLEYAFGWRPLISDIDSAITQFYLSQAARPIFEMCRGFAEDGQERGRIAVSYQPAGGCKTQGWRVDFEKVMVKIYGTYHSEGNGIANSHHYGFSPWEFIPTVWELIPYSFLVDYFTNIGGILSSWSYRFLAPKFATRTIIREGTRTLEDLKLVDAPQEFGLQVSTYGQPGGFTSWYRSVDRVPDVGLPLPSLEVKVPGNWTQWMNIAALTTQLDGTRGVLGHEA